MSRARFGLGRRRVWLRRSPVPPRRIPSTSPRRSGALRPSSPTCSARADLVVDSLATLPGEQPHSAHFNSDFQFNFTQFGTALVSQLVSVPLPSPAGGLHLSVRSQPRRVPRAPRRASARFSPIAPTRSARATSRSDLPISASPTTRSKASTSGSVPAVFTHDNAALRGGREDVVVTNNAIDSDGESIDDVRDAGRHRFARSVAGGPGRQHEPARSSRRRPFTGSARPTR